jgi:hypothetical protein
MRIAPQTVEIAAEIFLLDILGEPGYGPCRRPDPARSRGEYKIIFAVAHRLERSGAKRGYIGADST